MTSSEKILIQSLKKGSHTAFNEIYDMYAAKLYAFCMKYCKSAEDAEEIVEDTFVRLWEYKEKIRQENSVNSLLFITARRLVINRYRKRVDSPTYSIYLENIDEHINSNIHTDQMVEFDEFLNRLHKEINKLPKTQQKIITLSKLEGKKNQEIAQQLNLSIQTVKNQLSLAVKALKKGILLCYFTLIISTL